MIGRNYLNRVNPAKRRIWFLGVATGLAVLGGIVAVISLLSLSAPSYRGLTATQWIRTIGRLEREPATRTACEALREIGVASLPAVLHELRARDYPNWLRPVHQVYTSCGFSKLHRWTWDGPERRRQQGRLALEGIGPVVGVTALTNLMTHPNKAVRVAAARAVCRACKDDKNVVPALFVSAMQSPLPAMRDAGLEGFAYWSVLTSEGMAGVIQCASDPSPEVRRTALQVMSQYRKTFLDLLPAATTSALKKLTEDPNPQTRLEAGQTLQALVKASRTNGLSQ
jgi:hypothetical protein